MMHSLQKFIRKRLRNLGYIIQKYPSDDFKVLPVFDVCVNFLMSQSGEDLKFIQVGANDGVFGDPLRKYICAYPWKGVLVEPQTEVFERLKHNYSEVADRLIFENCAISSRVSELSMYRRKQKQSHTGDEAYAASVVSSKPRVIARQLGIRFSDLEEIKVPCLTLDALIKKHHIHDLDLLQIDTEGQDYEVIRTIDLSTTRPAIIQVEHGHLKPKEITELVSWLNKNAYDVLYGGYQTDTIAVERDVFSFQ